MQFARAFIPKEKANELGIIYSIWLDPSGLEVEKVDYQALFNVNREATVKVIRKAMVGSNRASIGCWKYTRHRGAFLPQIGSGWSTVTTLALRAL